MGISAGAGAAIAGGLSAAGGIAGSAMQSGATGKAAAQAQRNLQYILPVMQQQYDAAIRGYTPYQQAGQLSLQDQQDLLGLNGPDAANAAMAKFQTSPGYQWSLQQGLRATDAGAAARGILNSGATLKGEETFATGLADQEFGNYYNRLANLSSGGLTAATNMAAAGNNLVAQEEGNATGQAGIALGAGNAQSAIIGNAATGVGNTLNNLFNNQNFQNWLGIGNNSSSSIYGQGVSPQTISDNALYQQGAFAAQPTGTYGPFA